MPVEIKKLKITVEADDEGVKETEKGLENVDKKAKSTGETLQRLTTIFTAIPLLEFGRRAFDAAAKFDSLRRSLDTITGSSKETERQLVRLKEVAKLPGLGFAEAIQGSVRLQAAGLSATMAEKALQNLGNALATVGGGKAELDGVTLALSQIQSKGKVMAEEINQLAERVPQIRQIMIDAFGTADTEILQKANITSERFIETIVNAAGRLGKATSGISGDMENISDSVDVSMSRIGESIARVTGRPIQMLADALDKVTTKFSKLPKETQDLITGVTGITLLVGPVLALTNQFIELAKAISMARLASLGQWGLIVGAGALAFSPHLKALQETMALQNQSAMQDATLPQLTQINNAIPYLQDRIKALQNRNMGNNYSPRGREGQVSGEEGAALSFAGLTGNASINQIQAAIDRLNKQAVTLRWDNVNASGGKFDPFEFFGKVADDINLKLQVAMAGVSGLQAKAMKDAEEHARKLAEATAEAKKKLLEIRTGDDEYAKRAVDLRNEVEQYRKRGVDIKLTEQILSEGLAQIHKDRWKHLQEVAEEHQRKMIEGAKKWGELYKKVVAPAVFALVDGLSGGGLSVLVDNQKATADALEAQRELRNKLIDTMNQQTAATNALFAIDEKHRQALQLTQTAYESLDPAMQKIIDKIAVQVQLQREYQNLLKGLPGLVEYFGLLFARMHDVPMLPKSVPGPRGKTPEEARRQEIDRVAGNIGGVFSDAMAAGLNGGNAIATFTSRLRQSLINMLSDVFGNQVRNILKEAFSSLTSSISSEFMQSMKQGQGLARQIASFLQANVNALLAASYNLIAAMNRKKKANWLDAVVGIGVGVITGNPGLGIAAFNASNAVQNNDWGGLVMAGASAYAGQSSGPTDSQWLKQNLPGNPGYTGRSVVQNVNIYGGVHNAGDWDTLNSRNVDSLQQGLISTG